jgi:hypothetical protein
MTCTDCQIAESYGSSRLYNPACLRCGGRYLRAIKRAEIPNPEKVAWLRKALACWVAHGHSESALRELASATVKQRASTERTGRLPRRAGAALV